MFGTQWSRKAWLCWNSSRLVIYRTKEGPGPLMRPPGTRWSRTAPPLCRTAGGHRPRHTLGLMLCATKMIQLYFTNVIKYSSLFVESIFEEKCKKGLKISASFHLKAKFHRSSINWIHFTINIKITEITNIIPRCFSLINESMCTISSVAVSAAFVR